MQIVFELIARGRLHDHPCPVILYGAPNVGGGADRISHVVETIKECHKIVVFCGLYRFVMIIKSKELGFWKGLRHKDCGSSKAASHVRHVRTMFQLLSHSFKSGDPRADQVCRVTRTEEPLGADKEFRVVLVPAQSLASLEPFSDRFFRLDRGERHLKCTRKECGAALVRQGEGLFLVQEELAVRSIKCDVATRRLIAEPFTDVAFSRSCSLCQFRRILWPTCGKCFVESELIADSDESCMKGRPEIDNRSAQELVKLVWIQCHAVISYRYVV